MSPAPSAGALQGLQSIFQVANCTQQWLLDKLGVSLSLAEVLQLDGIEQQVDALLVVARVHVLSKAEVYFLQRPSDLRGPISLRNEAAAVSLLLAYLSDEGGNSAAAAATSPTAAAEGLAGGKTALLAQLLAYCERLYPEFASGDLALSHAQAPPPAVAPPPHSAAAAFERWAGEQGVGAAIGLASFGGLRGCAALRDIAPGDKVLSIPEEVLIYEDTVAQTDLGRMLMSIPGLSIDNLLILWTMIDRHDPDSRWAPYWPSLPDKYYTGLSFPPELVAQLRGTAAGLELERAQAHLREQYAATRPLLDMLLQAYPDHLKSEWFDYESYLWAAELWYSYAFEIEFPGSSSSSKSRSFSAVGARASGGAARAGRDAAHGGAGDDSPGPSSKPVMVPFACHVNHSPWPHVVRYGRVNPRTRTLDYPAFRPCAKGQQAFISYGPVPNLKLLCYYGFALPANPFDVVALTLELPEGPLAQRQARLLRRLGLGMDHSLQDGPLSHQLLACLRVVVATPEELAQMEAGAVAAQAPAAAQVGGSSSSGGGSGGKSKGKNKSAKGKSKAGKGGRQGVPAAGDAGAGAAAAGVVVWGETAPVGAPLNTDNERQALATLEAALRQLLAPLAANPLLLAEEAAATAGTAEVARGAAGAESGSSTAPAAEPGQAAASSKQQVQGEQQVQREGQEQAGAANENGFDADWRMSRHFCTTYLRGQVTIVQRALGECARLADAL